jgi:hypothetical protein
MSVQQHGNFISVNIVEKFRAFDNSHTIVAQVVDVLWYWKGFGVGEGNYFASCGTALEPGRATILHPRALESGRVLFLPLQSLVPAKATVLPPVILKWGRETSSRYDPSRGGGIHLCSSINYTMFTPTTIVMVVVPLGGQRYRLYRVFIFTVRYIMD